MEDIKYITVDYMVNYDVVGGLKCPHCGCDIAPNELHYIPLSGTNDGLIKKELYKPPYKCRNCGGRIEQSIC